MILSADTLRRIRPVEPFSERTVTHGMSGGLSLAGYDVHIREAVTLTPLRRFSLASTVEKFAMPRDVLGIVHDKSTWARSGLSVFNTVIEPGWGGWLTLELVYHGNRILRIREGSPIAQVVFHAVDGEGQYTGKYSDQPARPVPPIMEGGA